MEGMKGCGCTDDAIGESWSAQQQWVLVPWVQSLLSRCSIRKGCLAVALCVEHGARA